MVHSDAEFRGLIRQMVNEGVYPSHDKLVGKLGRTFDRTRSGLSESQTVIRREEVERAGYSWEASKHKRQLVKARS